MPTQHDRWLSRADVAAMLGVKRQTLATWAHLGTGPPYVRPTNGIVRYRQSDVDTWVEASMRTKAS